LLAHFGSLRAVVTANQADWQRISGIGPTRAAALETTFCASVTASLPRPCRGGRDPST
jgi:hypothetical protein